MIFNRRTRPDSRRTATEIAAAWALHDDSTVLSPKQQAEREAWLAVSKTNDEAYRTAVATLNALSEHAAQPAILALRQAALSAKTERRFGSRAVIAACLLGTAVAASLVVGWIITQKAPTPVAQYATEIGERSTIPLPDGSEMVLNTASTAEVSFSTSERAVHLLKGQALFTVAHDRRAPFRVYAADRVITAVGTAFDVRLEGQRVQVTMLEGRVRVSAAPNPRRAGKITSDETLSAGESMLASPEEPTRIKNADVERATSWRAGLLTFQDTPLVEAIAEINRYTDRPLSLTDASASHYAISGTFRTGEPDRFARTLTQLFPLELSATAQGGLQLKPRPPDRPVTKN